MNAPQTVLASLPIVLLRNLYRGALGCAVAALLFPASSAADEATLESVLAGYRAKAEETVLAAHRAAVADLDGKYLAALNRSLEAAQQAGRLEEALALRAERDRTAEGNSETQSDLADAPEALRQLRGTYDRARAQLLPERDRGLAPIRQKALESLDGLLAEFTRQGRLDEALAVRSAREALAAEVGSAEVAAAASEDRPAMDDRAANSLSRIPRDAVRHGRSRYKVYLVDEPVTWEEARERCREVGGELGWLDSPDDEGLIVGFMRDVVQEKGHAPIWVGSRLNADSEWEWVNGEAVAPGFWEDPSHADPNPARSAMVRWIDSFRASAPDAQRIVGYLCRWD